MSDDAWVTKHVPRSQGSSTERQLSRFVPRPMALPPCIEASPPAWSPMASLTCRAQASPSRALFWESSLTSCEQRLFQSYPPRAKFARSARDGWLVDLHEPHGGDPEVLQTGSLCRRGLAERQTPVLLHFEVRHVQGMLLGFLVQKQLAVLLGGPLQQKSAFVDLVVGEVVQGLQDVEPPSREHNRYEQHRHQQLGNRGGEVVLAARRHD
mmetsp:Transcript_179911/g.570817  ORF Transcript_179911/g.570817 Transcript_179911/m.570817 type:complete len:210 (-) Transcript_179911:1448-2077(-)